MKTEMVLCLLVLVCGVNSATADLMPIIEDDFNTYANGSIIGQGGWESYANGDSFVVQDVTVFEGAKALYNNSVGDNVIGKQGTLRADGRQAVYVRTENRDNWEEYQDGNVQIGMTKGLWNKIFLLATFKRDGHVAYYDISTGAMQNFATYDDNVWTLLEMEWRSSDKTARYRVNSEIWTDWKPIFHSASFVGVDYVGFDFAQPSGSGGVYFDTLTPEPATIGLLALGGIFLLRRKK